MARTDHYAATETVRAVDAAEAAPRERRVVEHHAVVRRKDRRRLVAAFIVGRHRPEERRRPERPRYRTRSGAEVEMVRAQAVEGQSLAPAAAPGAAERLDRLQPGRRREGVLPELCVLE